MSTTPINTHGWQASPHSAPNAMIYYHPAFQHPDGDSAELDLVDHEDEPTLPCSFTLSLATGRVGGSALVFDGLDLPAYCKAWGLPWPGPAEAPFALATHLLEREAAGLPNAVVLLGERSAPVAAVAQPFTTTAATLDDIMGRLVRYQCNPLALNREMAADYLRDMPVLVRELEVLQHELAWADSRASVLRRQAERDGSITALLEALPRFPVVRNELGQPRELTFQLFPDGEGDTRAVYAPLDGQDFQACGQVEGRSFGWLWEGIATDQQLCDALREAAKWAARNHDDAASEELSTTYRQLGTTAPAADEQIRNLSNES